MRIHNVSYWLVLMLALIARDGGTRASAEERAAGDGLADLVALLGQVDDSGFQLDLLKGMQQALRGRRNVKMPAGWERVSVKLANSKNDQVRRLSRSLSLVFGDQRAIAALRKTMLDPRAEATLRAEAIALLVENGVAELAPDLQKLVADRVVRGAALRGLSAYSHAGTPQVILDHYDSLSDTEKRDAIHTLASRAEYADRLLRALEKKQVPVTDVSAFTARQIQNLGEKSLTERLEKVWGAIRRTPGDKRKLIAAYKKKMTADHLSQANLPNGRLLFKKTCQQCHTLYGEGGKIGPDITGSNRDNLDYILENVIDPSAAVPRAYRVSVVETDEGRILSGIVLKQSKRTLTLQTANEQIVLDRDIIEDVRSSPVSMMPDGQLEKLKPEEVRDLIAYLATKRQVPLPAGKESDAP